MIKRRAVCPNSAFGGEQRADMGARAPIERRMVTACRQDDVDLDPAHGCQREHGNDAVVGQKIGRHDFHRRARRADRLQDHELNLLQILVGTRGYRPRHAIADGCERRKPALTDQALTGHEEPIIGKSTDDLRNDRGLPMRSACREPDGRVGCGSGSRRRY